MSARPTAPEFDCSYWVNSAEAQAVAHLRGRPVVVGVFQMLCPGCVSKLIPQMKALSLLFPAEQVAVLGLHSVFEHHAGMAEPSLRAFLKEYAVTFPVGVDRHDGSDPVPSTMRSYGFEGTPTILLIDAEGRLRRQTLGHLPDLQLGAEVMALIKEAGISRQEADGVCSTSSAEGAQPCRT